MPASVDDPIASEALSGLLGVVGGSRGVLFEMTTQGEGGFEPTAALGSPFQPGSAAGFKADCLLPRWLRVNRQVLSIPDDIGVCDALVPADRIALKDLGATSAIPLLIEDHLVAWATVAGAVSLPHSDAWPSSLHALAGRLQSARTAAQERTRTESVARTNKLSLTGQMAAGIAHEVRNPLAAVRSIVQLVKEGAVPESQRGRLLDNVVGEIDRVTRVVTNLLMLGRAPALRDEPIELMGLVADAVDFCRAYARQHGQTLEVAWAARLWVRGDAHELRQVLVNLLLNACQASQAGQTIVVQGRAYADPAGHATAVVEVVDHGSGMSATVLAQVFEPFFTTKANGGGLGLCLCRDVVRRYGGDIVVASKPGVGTTVTLTLPQ